MKQLGSFVVACIAFSVGCGDDPTFKIRDEPAGANCPSGGLRIEADGETFYSCSGTPSVERVTADAAGNPCPGPALRVTVAVEGSEPRVGYVCESAEDVDPALVAILDWGVPSDLAGEAIDCECQADPESRAECEFELGTFDLLSAMSADCATKVVALVGDSFPTADHAAVVCEQQFEASVVACLAAIDTTVCSQATEDARDACGDMESTCDELSDAFWDWMNRAYTVSYYLDCSTLGGRR